ncbi:chaperone protein dnaJ 20, chloroplastic-like [Cornus florida]|uniref:chaperone protein dnaJ 20, chloroplastic-like n=1 Tax=Cornus florida TaxID=4283 RepID=UPI0028981688|nr:chaperone protein dnaJ 20, chloroplastic-like [Cornus florida]
MSFGVIISGNEAAGFNLCAKPNDHLSSKFSMSEASSQLQFKTHVTKPSISIRTRTKATINNLYGTAQTTESFYELLGISESGNLSEIKKAYKQLALKYHPDVSPPERMKEYTRRFIRVQEAYETLSDPKTRAIYDRDLVGGLNLALSTRKRSQYDQRFDDWVEWRNRWQSQLSELKKRRENKDSRRHATWESRGRRQRSQTIFDDDDESFSSY